MTRLANRRRAAGELRANRLFAAEPSLADKEYLVWAPGSVVGVRVDNTVVERRVIRPTFVRAGQRMTLKYECECSSGRPCWVAPDKLQALGDDHRLVAWQPATDLFREIA